MAKSKKQRPPEPVANEALDWINEHVVDLETRAKFAIEVDRLMQMHKRRIGAEAVCAMELAGQAAKPVLGVCMAMNVALVKKDDPSDRSCHKLATLYFPMDADGYVTHIVAQDVPLH